MALIHCEHASFAYDGRLVLRDLHFSVKSNEYLCIVGENGSGKTTLIKGLLGLISPVSGCIQYSDGMRKDQIGYLPQKTQIQTDFPASVEEIVYSGFRTKLPFYTRCQIKTARRQMELLDILPLCGRSFQELSGGQQQRVLLARALCATRKMLLLDEPTAGLDPLVTKEMYALIDKLHREEKLTIVMISHDIRTILSCADRIMHIDHDNIFIGSPDEYRETAMGRIFAGGEEHV